MTKQPAHGVVKPPERSQSCGHSWGCQLECSISSEVLTLTGWVLIMTDTRRETISVSLQPTALEMGKPPDTTRWQHLHRAMERR